MFQYTCLNPSAAVGLDNLTEDYTKTEDFAQADAVLVRSAAMHDRSCLISSARSQEPVPVSIIFRLTSALRRVSLYSTHRVPMQTV